MLPLLLSGANLVAGASAASSLFNADTKLLQSRQSCGCGVAPPKSPGSWSNGTIAVQGDPDREYSIWIPATYDENTPTSLILSYHGARGHINSQAHLDLLWRTDFNTESLVVYLQGGTITWEGVPGALGHDLDFTRAIIDLAEDTFCIDQSRIFATGKSQGGGFVGQQLACNAELSARIAAFSPVSGAYYLDSIDEKDECTFTLRQILAIPCNNSRSDIPMLAFHGGADPTIDYWGDFRRNACIPAVKHWAESWAERDGLSTTPVNISIPDSTNGINMTFGPDGLVTLVYDGDTIPHDWPATFENSDNQGQNLTSFNATTWIVGFFNAHSLA